MSVHSLWWDYPRFKQNNVKVLLVSLRHLLLSEISNALKRLGHSFYILLIEKNELERHLVEQMFNKAIKEFQPDFVLTVNHLGFDQEGVVTGLLTSYKIPFASWYVDSPYLIINHYEKNRSFYLTLFLWDKDYIKITKNLGFDKVVYLPLGVDDTIFNPMVKKQDLTSPVSFVGNSMVAKVNSVLLRYQISGSLLYCFDKVSKAFENSSHIIVRKMMKETFPDLFKELMSLPEIQAIGYETAVTWQATSNYRLKLVKQLKQFNPLIVGDKGWENLLDSSFKLHRELNYYSELSGFYNSNPINFNATSRQMKNGVNQRVFDVPACKSLVITDWTNQLESLMEPGKEVLAYKGCGEIAGIVKQAVNDKKFCERVACAGYNRVINEHTYFHRIKKLVYTMRKYYG